jgi:hypothetical protein
MFAYGISILLLIRQLKKEFPLVEQPWWYADDAGAGGKFDRQDQESIFATRRAWSYLWLLPRVHQEHPHCCPAQSCDNLVRAKSVFEEINKLKLL